MIVNLSTMTDGVYLYRDGMTFKSKKKALKCLKENANTSKEGLVWQLTSFYNPLKPEYYKIEKGKVIKIIESQMDNIEDD
jgi:hypothetical protein